MAKKKKKGGGKSYLYDPTKLLGGKRLLKASNQLTRLELRPAIMGYKRQGEAIERQRAAAETGLTNLGTQTAGRVRGVYNTLAGSSAQSLANQKALAERLNQDTSRISNEAATNLQSQQSGILGGITESLASRNVPPGGSAAQAALAQQAQAQQQAAAQAAQARGAFASAQGATQVGLSSGMAQAAQNRGAEAQSNIASMIAQRIAESNLTHREAGLEALGKRKDAKALWGATRLKNLLQLRGGEREYGLSLNPPRDISESIVRNIYSGTINKKNKYSGLPGGAGSPKSGGKGKKKKPKKPRK